jgi:hypothetical protein
MFGGKFADPYFIRRDVYLPDARCYCFAARPLIQLYSTNFASCRSANPSFVDN